MADVWLMRAIPRNVPATSSTSPRVCGTYFELTRTMWLKAIRFYRGSTSIYGNIQGCIYRYSFAAAAYVQVPDTVISINLNAGSGPTGWVEMVYPTPVKIPSTFDGGGCQVVVKFPGGSGNQVPYEWNWWVPDSPQGPGNDVVKGGFGLYAPWEKIAGRPSQPQIGQSAYAYSSVLVHPSAPADGDHGLDVRLDELDPNDPTPADPLWRMMPFTGVPYYPTVFGAGVTADQMGYIGTILGFDFEPVRPAWVTALRIYTPYTGNYNGGTWVTIWERQDDGTTWQYLNGTTTRITTNASTTGYSAGWVEVGTQGYPPLIVGRRYRIIVSQAMYYPVLKDYYAAGGPGATTRTVGPIRLLPGGYTKQGSNPGNNSDTSLPTTPTNDHPLIDFYATVEDPFANPNGGGFGDPLEPNETAQRLWGVGAPGYFQVQSGSITEIQEFEVNAPARAYGIRFYRPNTTDVTGKVALGLFTRPPLMDFQAVPGALYTYDLSKIPNRSGWMYVPFQVPVKLAVGTRYFVAALFPNGYVVTPDYFTTGAGQSTAAMVHGRLQIPEEANAIGRRPHNYWLDVTISPWNGTPTGAKGSFAEPGSAIRLWGTDVPTGIKLFPTFWRSQTYDVSMQFSVDADATGHGLRFYRVSDVNGIVGGQVVARLYELLSDQTGKEVIGGDVTFTDNATVGWQYAAFRAPLKLRAGRQYAMVFFFPSGFPVDFYFFGGRGLSGNDATDAMNAGVAAATDVVSGILRVPSPANAYGGTPFRFHFGGVLNDNIAWPISPIQWNPYLDITVTEGTAAAYDGQERDDSLNSRGNLRPPPTSYGDIHLGPVPGVVAHDMQFTGNVTVYGVRWYLPDLRYVTGQVAIYNVQSATIVPGTLTTMPPATGFAGQWVYIPFNSPVVLEGDRKYRLATSAPGGVAGVPIGRAKVLETGLLSDINTWYAPGGTMVFPDDPDLNDYMLDLSYTAGGELTGGVVKTLFRDDSYFDEHEHLTMFYSLNAPGRTVGVRFGVNETVWATGLRFFRATVDVDGPILGRIWAIHNDLYDDHENRGRIGEIIPGTECVIEIAPDDVTLGWVVGNFPQPVPLRPGVLYCAALWFPSAIVIGEGYFLPGHAGDTGSGPVLGPKGSLYWGGTDWAPNTAQGVSQAGSSPKYPWIGNYKEDLPVSAPERRPAGHNYFVDVLATDKPPDVEPIVPPRQPVSYSIYGRFPFVGDPPVGTSIMAGLEFYVTDTAYVHAYRFPRTNQTLQRRPVIAGLYEITGEDTGTPIPESFGEINMIPAIWQSAHFSPAVKVVPGKRYKLVMQFLGAHPSAQYFQWEGVSYIPYSADTVRGPMVIPSDANAIGRATATWSPANTFIYPIFPAVNEATRQVGHYLDLLVSPEDPYPTPNEIEHSLFGRSLPPVLRNAALRRFPDPDGVSPALNEHRSSGVEVYFTQSFVYLTQLHYWRTAYPQSTVLQEMAVYEVISATEGTEVPGTRIQVAQWPDSPSAPGGAAWAEGWVTINLPSPVVLDGSKRYRIAGFFPYRQDQASVPITDSYWATGFGGAGRFSGPMVAPNRDQSVGEMQGPVTAYLSTDGANWHLEYPGTGTDEAGVAADAAQYWFDVTILDTAPRTVDGGTVIKTMGVNRRERRGGGLDAEDTPVAQLDIQATPSALKEVSGEASVALEVVATPFSGKELIQQNVGVTATALAISKYVNGGTVDSALGLQSKLTRSRKATGEDASAEIEVVASAYESFRWAPIPREAISLPFTYNPQNIRFIAQNIMTRQFLHMDLPINNPSITWRLSGPFELTGSIAPPYADVLDLMMDEWSTFIHVEYQGYIMGTGILMPWSADENTLNIEAIGITTYPHGIPYMDYFHQFFPDVMEVIREMWRHIQSFPNGNMGVLLPTGYMGVPMFGKVHYDDQTGALLGWEEYVVHWTDFTDIGTLIDNLAVSTPFDYQEVHAWNSTHTDILHGINFGYPRLGGKRDDLKFEQGANIVATIPISEPEDAYASDVIVKGSGEGVNQIFMWVGASIWDRLRRVVVITDEQVSDPNMAYGIANQEILRRLFARGVDKIVVEAFHLYAPLGTYNVGDDILVDAMIPWVGEFLLWHRITSIEFNRDAGLITMELARSESFRYGRPRPQGT